MKSIFKLIYGYLAVTYTMLFVGVLVSDTLYAEPSRILCASSVTRKFVPEILNVPTFVPWALLIVGAIITIVCAKVLQQFTIGIGAVNGLLGLYTLIIYAPELKNFFPFSMSQPTIRSAFLVIGSYLIVILSIIMIPLIIFSKDDDVDPLTRIW